MISIQPQEMAEVSRRLGMLANGIQSKAVRSGLVYAAQPVKAAMRANAPRLTGALSRSIGHEAFSASAKARAGIAQNLEAVSVGPKQVRISARQLGKGLKRSQFSGEAWLVHILEETGAKAHRVYATAYKAGNAKRNARLVKKYGMSYAAEQIGKRKRAMTIRGGLFRAANVAGFRPKGFISGALDAAGSQVSDRFWEGVVRYLDKKGI